MEMLHGKICIRERIRNSIYSRKGEKTYFICLAKGRFPGKRVSLVGLYFLENGAWRAFGASVLNKFEFLTMYHLQTFILD